MGIAAVRSVGGRPRGAIDPGSRGRTDLSPSSQDQSALRQMLHPPIDAGSQRKAVATRGKEHAQHQSHYHQKQIHHNIPQPNQQPVRGRPLAEKPAGRSACEVINGQNQRANDSFARGPAEFSRPHAPDPIAVS